MGRQISYLALAAPARILGSIEIKWGISFNWDWLKHFREYLVSVSQETQNFSYNFWLVYFNGIFPQFHLFRSLSPPTPHLFLNTPVIKDKGVGFFHYLNCVNSLSSHLVSLYQYFSYTKNHILLNILKFWKGNSATWDGNSATSSDF